MKRLFAVLAAVMTLVLPSAPAGATTTYWSKTVWDYQTRHYGVHSPWLKHPPRYITLHVHVWEWGKDDPQIGCGLSFAAETTDRPYDYFYRNIYTEYDKRGAWRVRVPTRPPHQWVRITEGFVTGYFTPKKGDTYVSYHKCKGRFWITS